MIRPCLEDRVQVDGIEPDALEVIELLFDPLQVAAEVLVAERALERAGRARVENRFVPRRSRDQILIAVDDGAARRGAGHAVIVRRVSVAEAVREYVIDVRRAEPFGRLKILIVDRELE